MDSVLHESLLVIHIRLGKFNDMCWLLPSFCFNFQDFLPCLHYLHIHPTHLTTLVKELDTAEMQLLVYLITYIQHSFAIPVVQCLINPSMKLNCTSSFQPQEINRYYYHSIIMWTLLQ